MVGLGGVPPRALSKEGSDTPKKFLEFSGDLEEHAIRYF
jgi:hypothetical protein